MATRALTFPRPLARPKARRPPRVPPRATRPPGARARNAVMRRRAVAAGVVLLVLYGGYMLWFRNLSIFAINEVSVEGATTSQQQIQAAVEQAAQDMTTLHIKDDELAAAVSRFPTVAAVKADTSFPHGMQVTI